MKALLTLKLCGLAVLGLLMTACSLLPMSPSLSLSVQTSDYTSSPVNIPYSFQTLSQNSDGSAQCTYALSQFDSMVGGFQWISGNTDITLPSSGTLSFPLTTILNVTAGSTAIDGLYSLSFSVLSNNYDQNGNRIPFPFLTKSASLTVHTSTGPMIYSTKPLIVNIANGATTVTFTGTGFTPGGSLNQSTYVTGLTYVGPQTITASVNLAGLTAGSLSLVYTDAQGTLSPTYNLPAVSTVAVSNSIPTTGSNQSSDLPLEVDGSYLGYWTTVTISDSSGHTATMNIQQVGGSLQTTSLYGYIDLTPLTTIGPGTLTVTNPDGTSAQLAFTVTN